MHPPLESLRLVEADGDGDRYWPLSGWLNGAFAPSKVRRISTVKGKGIHEMPKRAACAVNKSGTAEDM